MAFRQHSYNGVGITVFMSSTASTPVCRERVVSIQRQQDPARCVLANRTNLRVSGLLASYLAIGDEITFPMPAEGRSGVEIYITKGAPSGLNGCLYQASIGHVTPPKPDKRSQYFVSAEVQEKALGISTILVPCGRLRDYFYGLGGAGKDRRPTFYETLGIPASASSAELRVAYKLRLLELVAGTRSEQSAAERAFNILGQPPLRACYDALLADPGAAATFPYGGFGSLLVSGERSRDGQTFFARRILSFSPERRRRRFHLPLGRCHFYQDRAFCRDVRRKLEFWLDPALLYTLFDPTWNQWKHLLAAKMEIEATFVPSGKYRKRGDEWELVTWETALPSRLAVKLPADFEQQVETARRTYQRFGQYSRELEQIRVRLQSQAIEKTELERVCQMLGMPADFDVSHISWRVDYDPLFYRQLARRARRIYLFRDEYIFDLEKAVVVETPQLGHATYMFSKPRTMDGFLALYTQVGKEDIRRNRDNAAQKLGFLGRVIHGNDPTAWLKEIRQGAGEKADFRALVENYKAPAE